MENIYIIQIKDVASCKYCKHYKTLDELGQRNNGNYYKTCLTCRNRTKNYREKLKLKKEEEMNKINNIIEKVNEQIKESNEEFIVKFN